MDRPPPAGESELLNPLQHYLNQAGETPLLAAEQERVLGVQMRIGDREHDRLLEMVDRVLRQHLREMPVRRALEYFRPVFSADFRRHAEEEIPGLRRGFVARDSMSDRAVLSAAIDVAKQKVPIRNRQTNDTEIREVLDTLLHVAHVTEERLIPAAKRFASKTGKHRLCERMREAEQCMREAERARDSLRKANLLLVVSIAGKPCYDWGDLTLDDRIQEGNVGLMKAVDGFDPETHGTRFSTYAVPFIEQAIDRALRNQSGTVRRPLHVQHMVSSFRGRLRDLEARAGHGIGLEEGMERLGLSPADSATVMAGLRTRRRVALVFDDGDERFANGKVADAEKLEAEQEDTGARVEHFRATVRSVLHVLTKREAAIITSRLGLGGKEPMMQRDIADRSGVTRSRVQQVEVRAIEKLEAALGVTNGHANGRVNGKITHGSYARLFRHIEVGAERLERQRA